MLSLLNHIGFFLIILIICYVVEFFDKKDIYDIDHVPAGAAVFVFVVIEILYWIIQIFFINCFNI